MHEQVNPPSLLDAVGFSHAVVAAPGRTVYLGGQTGHHGDGGMDDGLLAQFEQALRNLVTVLDAVGGRPDDIVSLHVYVTDVETYRALGRELGEVWRDALGRHYPAMALFEVTALHDPRAVVELVPVAVVPEGR